MESAFVAHATPDRYFVNLLVALLEHHDIRPWCSYQNLVPGGRYRDDIDIAIDACESMIVVVSRNAAKTKWITRELTLFQTRVQSGPIVPVLLDDTAPEAVSHGLDQYQAIDFARCMKSGFETLLEDFFGTAFLPREERRSRPDRRLSADDRRELGRRRTTLRQRILHGLWRRFEEQFSVGKHEQLKVGVRNLEKTVDVLLAEADRYQFTDASGREVDPRRALREAATEAERRTAAGDDWTVTPINFVESIATYLVGAMHAKPIDRRADPDRRERRRRKFEPRGPTPRKS